MDIPYIDIIKTAKILECSPAAVLSVIYVETPWSYVKDELTNRPLILNERHWFYKLTDGISDDLSICNKKPGGYCKGNTWMERQNCEHVKLEKKINIDKEAALKSISMGLFQIMGFNYEIIGYDSVEVMWKDALINDNSIYLEWFIKFIKHNKLDIELRNLNWKGFARKYNGTGYKKNKYDEKLEHHYHDLLPKFRNYSNFNDLKKMVILPPVMLKTGFPDFSQKFKLI